MSALVCVLVLAYPSVADALAFGTWTPEAAARQQDLRRVATPVFSCPPANEPSGRGQQSVVNAAPCPGTLLSLSVTGLSSDPYAVCLVGL